MEPYKPHRMGDHSDTHGCAGDDDPCYCTKPKEVSLQKESECCDGECNHDDCCGKIEANCTHKPKESEWELKLRNWQDCAIDAGYDFPESSFSALKRIFSEALSNREKEIAEEVEKLNWHEDFDGGLRMEWLKRHEVLSILKH